MLREASIRRRRKGVEKEPVIRRFFQPRASASNDFAESIRLDRFMDVMDNGQRYDRANMKERAIPSS
jgi:hypothetical protein